MTPPDRPTVEPADVDEVEGFLEALDDDTPVGVTARFGVRTRRVFTTSVERIPPSPKTGARPPFFTVTTNDGNHSVEADHIERITAYETPLTRREYDVAGSGAEDCELANRVRQAAIQAPAVVNVAHPLELLRSDDPTTHSHALSALSVLCRERPADCVLAIPSLVTVLESGTTARPATALGCLATIADDHPREVAPWADRLCDFVTATDERTQRAALRLLSNVAAADAAACIDALPSLEAVVEGDGGDGDGGDGGEVDDDRRERAVYVVQRVAQEAPTAVEPLVPALVDALDDTDDGSVVANATIALGTVSKQYPGVALDAVEPAVRWLDADERVVRNNAIGMLADVALHNAHAIVPHVDHVRSLVDDEDDYARINATGVLARLAKTAPDTVDDVDRFLDALADDQHLVRVNACWALGELGVLAADPDRVRDRLREVEANDENEAVRRRAAWALDQLTTGRRRS